jgi:hypothetical protein
MGSLSITRNTLLVVLMSCSIGCSPGASDNADREAVRPQSDQVQFFERPATLVAARKADQPAPLVVLLENDPWRAVIGSDSPMFALYEDGTVIQRVGTGFTTTRLTAREMKQVVGPLDLSRYYGRFVADDASDQPEQTFLDYRSAKPVFVSVYGSLHDREVRSRLPKDVVSAYDTLIAFRHPRSRPWLPEHVEVMIWPDDHARDPSVRWPQEWPDLDDPRTVRRGEDSFSLYLSSARLPEVRALLGRVSAKGALELDGRTWSASIRFPFPLEDLWMADNSEAEETGP